MGRPKFTTRLVSRVLVCGIVVYGAAAGAHHSISGAYDPSEHVTLEGSVTNFWFISPHPFVTLAVGVGPDQLWTLEMDNRWELAELGFKADTLKPGERIRVDGNPARNEPHRLYVRRLEILPDGFVYEHHK